MIAFVLVASVAVGCSGDDSGVDFNAACVPQDVGAWVPHWVAPRTPSNVCTAEQLQSIYDNCESESYSRSACNALAGACTDCIYTASTDAKYGAVVYDSVNALVNDAGCIALVEGDLGATGCGAKVQAVDACEEQACASVCEQADWSTFVQCMSKAAKTVCSAYSDAALCRAHPSFYVCEAYTTYEEYFLAIAQRFCSNPGAKG